ncbi:MAG: permease [Candidatus Thermoplasmatota archaeon]|nr:hypothetical protein [Euryarchaeota archaeon]MBU4033022.1 permease [Candidatus Thermoplasmatota archaeon]MBU4071260.1 permease [Candidatus Thermoplasmatota archaeon]MBU4144389.1 permease [Candidatus Thermoplasmatota archaeon]MBU4591316.1 permease [Candidatus Thermoplasmatota archaeon]
MAGIEDLTIGDFSIHQFLSMLLIIFTGALWIFGWMRRHWKKLDGLLLKTFNDANIPDKYKIWFMGIAAIGAVFLYLYCWMCQITETAGLGEDREYLDWLFRDLLGILPWFIWGCVLAGFMVKYMGIGKIKLPKSMLGAGAMASLLPICSCAAVPLAHGMLMGKQMRVRTVITFLIVVPVLSPIVIILAFARIGWEYIVIEVISVFALAMIAGIFIERFVGVKEPDACGKGCYTCEGCKSSNMLKSHSSALLASWDQFMYLMKYIFLGLIIGAALSVYIDAETISHIFGSQGDLWGSIPGLFLIVLMGIPLFICSGEDVLILAPLLASGALPLGHAIAFAITGNAICITSIPVLIATFGKKVTALLLFFFFVGSIIIGFIINSLVWVLG